MKQVNLGVHTGISLNRKL